MNFTFVLALLVVTFVIVVDETVAVALSEEVPAPRTIEVTTVFVSFYFIQWLY